MKKIEVPIWQAELARERVYLIRKRKVNLGLFIQAIRCRI
jgi:hypothetical protein